MATGKRPNIGCRVDEDVAEAVEEYQERQGYDDRSDAHRQILKAGLREVQGPVPVGWRELALNAAYHLTLVSVVVVVMGFSTDMVAAGRAVSISIVIMTVALAPIAGIECVRLLRGQSTMGDNDD